MSVLFAYVISLYFYDRNFFFFVQSAIDEVQRRNFQSFFLPINPVNPCLVFYVSRDSIVQDTVQQLMQQGSGDLKKPLKVITSLF